MKKIIFAASLLIGLNAHAYVCSDVTQRYSVTPTATASPFDKPATATINNGPFTSVLTCTSQTATFDKTTTICEGNLHITYREYAPVRLILEFSQFTGYHLAALVFTDGSELDPMSCD